MRFKKYYMKQTFTSDTKDAVVGVSSSSVSVSVTVCKVLSAGNRSLPVFCTLSCNSFLIPKIYCTTD